jgi:uncharacterized protein (TIGR02246 family)
MPRKGRGFFLENSLMKITVLLAIKYLLVLLASPAIGSTVPATGNAQALVQACTQLNHQYAIARDLSDAAAYARIFADDAVFEMQGETYRGREAILERLTGTEANYFARLLVTTVAITPLDERSARGLTYFTMYQAPKGAEDELPITTFKTFMGEYHDHYEFDGEHCQLSRRETRPLFMGTAEEQ